jgi:hypothetical protein
LLPRVLGGRPFQEYRYYDGEIITASVIGWNFGEGHLSGRELLAAVQSQCGFEEGELRVLTVESQPLFGSSLEWHIYDAARGHLDQGCATLEELKRRKPWDYGG